jgi:solute:Na+ symporter, SSS family
MGSWIFATIVLGTLIVTNLVAFLGRGPITSRIYGADPNAHAWYRISVSIIGTIVGGGMFLAVGQIGYEAGVVGYLVGFTYVIGLGIVAYLAPKIRKVMDEGGFDTLLDLLESKYSRVLAMHFAFVNFVMCLFLLSAQMLALYSFARYASTLSTHTWVPWALIGAGVLSMALYTIVGGLRKDIWADIAQVLIVIVAGVFLVRQMVVEDAFGQIWAKIPASHLSGTGYGIVFLIGVAILLPPSFLVRVDMWQRMRAASSHRAASVAFLLAGLGSLVFYVLFTTVGMWARVEGGHTPKTATLEMISGHFKDPTILGIIIGGLFAAVLSSADSFVNICSVFLAKLTRNDLWQKARTSKSADRTLLFWERACAVGSIGIAILIALGAGNLVDLIVGALSILLIYLVPIIGTFADSLRSTLASLWSTTIGLVLFVVLFFSWNPKLSFAPAIVLAWLVYGVVVFRERIVARRQHRF